MRRTEPISSSPRGGSGGTDRVPGAARFLAVLLSLSVLVTPSYAEGDPAAQEESLVDGLESIAAELPESPGKLGRNSSRTSNETDLPAQQQQAETSVEGVIDSRDKRARDPTARAIYPEAYYRIRRLLKRWQEKLGLEVTLSYDVAGQYYTDDLGNESGIAGDASLSGRWLLFGQKFDLPVYLTFQVRRRDALSNMPPSDIGPDTGLFWKTVSGFSDAGFQVPNLYFSQELGKRRVILRYGQFSIDSFFDSHRLRSAKKYFLNYAFADNPAVNFPSFGAGAVLQWNPSRRWELTGGASNIQSVDQKDQVDFGLDSSALFEALQARYRLAYGEDRSAELGVMGWHNASIPTEGLKEEQGISVTLGVDGPTPEEELIFRLALSDGNSTPTDVLMFAGFGKTINSFDQWGIGVAAGRSTESSKWQVMFETYYRWWVFKELMITPDFQLTLGEHLGRDTRASMVAGLRFGFIF